MWNHRWTERLVSKAAEISASHRSFCGMSVPGKHASLVLSGPQEETSWEQTEISATETGDAADQRTSETGWSSLDYKEDQVNKFNTYPNLNTDNRYVGNIHRSFESLPESNGLLISSPEIQSCDESSADTDVGNSDSEFVSKHVLSSANMPIRCRINVNLFRILRKHSQFPEQSKMSGKDRRR